MSIVNPQGSQVFAYGYYCCGYAFDVVSDKALTLMLKFFYPFWLHPCKFLASMLLSLLLSLSPCVAQLGRMKTSIYKCI